MQRVWKREDVGVVGPWQPHGAIWLPFGPLAPVAPVLPGLPLVPKSPLRVSDRGHDTPLPHLPSEAGSRLRLFLGVRRSA